MAGLEFSAPYNNDPETLEEIFKLKNTNGNSIKEIYLPVPQEYSGSGRWTPEMKMDEFIKIVNRIHEEGIRVNIIFNSTCENDWYSVKTMDAKMNFIKQAHLNHKVEAITITNPIYIKQVRYRFPDMEICASVLGDIDCVEKAEQFVKAGAHTITPDVNINRDLEMLKKIKEATKVKLKLMLNEGCLYKCAFRKFHFNFTSHKSKDVSIDYANLGMRGDEFFANFHNNCLRRTAEDNSQILKSRWIRPEDVTKYSDITTFFKIVGRNQTRRMVVRTTKAYLQESYDRDLFDLLCASLRRFSLKYGACLDNKALDKYNFFEKVTSCGGNCDQCNYCNELANKLVIFGLSTPEKREDMV